MRSFLIAVLLLAPTAALACTPCTIKTSPDQYGEISYLGADADICTDRPGKGAAPCTVPQSTWQVENDVYDEARMIGPTTVIVGQPTLKYGLGPHDDVGLTVTPYERTGRNTGLGDMALEEKHALINTPVFQLSLQSSIKLPSASHGLGNGHLEGGFAAPWVLNLTPNWSINSAPQVSWVLDQNRRGYHAAESAGLAVQRQLIPNLFLSGDVWATWDHDPANPTMQATTDYAMSYIWRHDYQVDWGVAVGLNRATAPLQFYVGLSRKF